MFRPAGLLQRSLQARLIAAFLLFSMTVVALLCAYSSLSITRETTRAALHNLEAIAGLKEQALQAWIKDQERKVRWLADMPEVVRLCGLLAEEGAAFGPLPASPQAGMRELFHSTLRHLPEFQEIQLLSAVGGRVLLSSRAENEGQYRVQDRSFLMGRQGTFVSGIHPSPLTLQPTLAVSTPLRGPRERLLGVLVVNLDLEWLDRVIQERAGLGWSGEAYLVDGTHTFVSAQRFGRTDFPRGIRSAGIDAALKGGIGSGIYPNYRGVPVLGSYRWNAALETALLVEMERRAALTWVRRQTATLLMHGLLFAALLAVGVYLLARQITRPILRVRQAALQVAAGDLAIQVPVPTGDEIGDLARAFNTMTSRLNEVYGELRRREEHFRSLTESSADILAVLSVAGRLRFVSPSVEKILGYRPEELQGRRPFHLVHLDDLPRLAGEFRRTEIAPGAAARQTVFRLRHRDGSWRTMEATARSLLAHPAIRGIVANVRDISERQQLEEKLLQARKMEAVGRLAGGVAHDFNNLLTVIIGYTETLQLDGNLGPEARADAREIRRAADRAAALTRQLLAYSRKQILQVRPVNLNRLVRGMWEMLQRLIGEHIRLSDWLQPDLATVRADPNQLEQVIMNLAVNARDAMPEGGTLTISTRDERLDAGVAPLPPEASPGGHVLLEIRDTGAGMDPPTLEKIFEPFFTTKEVGKGTGLGLATVLGIVQQSGGSIAVASETGRGSTFTIRLPAVAGVVPAPATAHEAASEATLQPGPAPAGLQPGGGSILLVEDEDAVRRMIHTILVRCGYRVQDAADPAEALRLVEDPARFSLLITDLVMPGMSGRQLAAELLRRTPGLKVLYISGYTDDAGMRRAAAGEEFAFLQKPFAPAALTGKVREILEEEPA